jgi:hypothetical protein
MKILSGWYKKGSLLFRGKFGETFEVRGPRYEQDPSWSSFAEKSAKPTSI